MKDRIFPRFVVVAIAGLIAGALFIFAFVRSTDTSLICSFPFIQQQQQHQIVQPTTSAQLNAILHYATSKITPQQSQSEIKVSFNVLQSLSPCNFLVFGLGFDSLMWNSFNPQGKTLFLEEDPSWVQTVLKDAPGLLHAHTVKYNTRLDQADHLLTTYKQEPYCLPSKAFLKGNNKCKLALNNLPDEVYDTQWDLIMVDAPRGYAAELPGRMAAIFSAAVMARQRSNGGVTHVFLHDVNRRVEKIFAQEFLCRKYLVKAVGRLWHFEIPSAVNVSDAAQPDRFC